jgi:outer membrane protein OmpA-like peptidoglycan-associated protein
MSERDMTKARVTNLIRLALILVVTGLIAPSLAQAADKAGCRDIPGIKRFDRSSIELCQQRNFAEYTLPTGRVTAYDYDRKKADFEKKEDLEGRLTQNVYAVPPGPSSAEVFRNYKSDLEAAGFKILFEAKQDETKNLEAVFENMGPGGQLFGYSADEARYAAAVREQGGERTYIALYIIEYQDGYVPEFEAKKGQVYVRLDALQAGKLADRMVVVSSAEIAKALDTSGKVVLYGIQFDFNKSTLRPESRPTLDEIGKFLRVDPAQKLYVIGHTDNVGGFDFNIQLSQARASAVAAELIKSYGIAPARLRASGVGLQAPIASNVDEDGRAKNRRVELLPQ